MTNSSVRQQLAASGVLSGVDVHWIEVVMMASSSVLLVCGRGGFLAVGVVQATSESLLSASLSLSLSVCLLPVSVCVSLSLSLSLCERAALLL